MDINAANVALSPDHMGVYRSYHDMIQVGMPAARVHLLMLLSRVPKNVIHAVLIQPRDTCRKVEFNHPVEQEFDAIAALMVKRGQWDEAYRWYSRLLALQRELNGPVSKISKSRDHTLLHSTYNHLIYVLLVRQEESTIPCRFEKAMEVYQEKLDFDWDSLSDIDYRGSGSWESCQLLNSVLLENRRNDVLLWYQNLAETREANGEAPVSIAIIYHRMALLLDKGTNSPEIPMAIELYEKALHQYLKSPRDNLDKIEVTCSKLLNQRNRQSDDLLGKGNDQKILELYHQLVEVYTLVCGESDVMVVETFVKMAQFLEWRSRLEECINIYTKLADVQRRTLGEDDIALGTTYYRIARLTRRQNNFEETRKLYVRILDIYHKNHEKADATIVSRSYVYMAELLVEMGRLDDAINLCERWLRACEDQIFAIAASEDQRNHVGSDYSNKLVQKTLSSLADRFRKEGRVDEALDVCRRFLNIYKVVFGKKPHALVVHGRRYTATILREQGKQTEAAEMENLANETAIALIVQKTYWKGGEGSDLVATILDQTNRAASQEVALRDETKEFLHTLQMYLNCRKKMDAKYLAVDEFQVIAKFSISTDSNGIECAERRRSFKKKYQQQNVEGQTVRTLNELYDAAERARPIFRKMIENLVSLVREKLNEPESAIVIKFANLKGRDRSCSKANDDYASRDPGPAISWLFDIVRASVEFTSAAQVRACLEIIKNDNAFHIVKAKNRFLEPAISGYRDVNIQFQIETKEGFKHICELQIHHQAILVLDRQLQSHSYYEYFRKYFAGSTGSLQTRLQDLKQISEGGVIDDSFLVPLVETSDDEERLERLGALFWHQLCEYNWALRVYRRLFDIQSQRYGAHDFTVAATHLKIAKLVTEKGNLNEAWELCKACLRLRTNAHDEDNPVITEVYMQMALILTDMQGALEDALVLYRHVLEIQNASFGAMSLPTADTLNHIADVLTKLGKIDEAACCLEDSIEIKESNLGEEHSSVAAGLQVMARLMLDQGKLEDALNVYDRSLEIAKKTLGEEHSLVAKILRSKARVLHDQGKLEEAFGFYMQSLELLKKNYGEGHSLVADTHGSMSDLLHQQGKLSEAEEYESKARDAKRKKLGLGGVENTLLSSIQSRKGWLSPLALKGALKPKGAK